MSEKCDEANIEENDFTTYTYDELAYELDLVKSSVLSKVGFLENQLVARDMTNLTPIQLEEFESVFRHFDREGGNCLKEVEFSAALASLGLVYDEDEMHTIFDQTSKGKSVVTFEQFIHFMVEVTEDQNTAEQVFQSFREVADGKVSTSSLRLFPTHYVICPFPFTSGFPHRPLLLLCVRFTGNFQVDTEFIKIAALRNRARPPTLSHPRRARQRPTPIHATPSWAGPAGRPQSAQIRLHQFYGEDDAGRGGGSGKSSAAEKERGHEWTFELWFVRWGKEG